MTDLTLKQQSFVQDNIPMRLRNLAAHLVQIQSLLNDATLFDKAVSLIRESRYFIEWTAQEMDIDDAAELVELGRALTRWLFNWEKIWSDATARMKVTQEAGTWSERMLDMSGLSRETVSQ